jgi:hypothetical protein
MGLVVLQLALSHWGWVTALRIFVAQSPEFIAGVTRLNAAQALHQLEQLIRHELTVVLPLQGGRSHGTVSGGHGLERVWLWPYGLLWFRREPQQLREAKAFLKNLDAGAAIPSRSERISPGAAPGHRYDGDSPTAGHGA